MNLTMIFPYFENKGMVKEHIERYWRHYPDDIKKQIQIIVVDDCSSEAPIDTVVEMHEELDKQQPLGITTHYCRVEKKKRWNWLICRNIGATIALPGWLLLTDMDHAVPKETLCNLFQTQAALNPDEFYTFKRVSAPEMLPYKPHLDSFLMAKDFYWKVGGYDETYSGEYGTAGMWRRRCEEVGPRKELPEVIIRYPREVIPDASTTQFARKEGRDPLAIKRITAEKEKRGEAKLIKVLDLPWKQVRTFTYD